MCAYACVRVCGVRRVVRGVVSGRGSGPQGQRLLSMVTPQVAVGGPGSALSWSGVTQTRRGIVGRFRGRRRLLGVIATSSDVSPGHRVSLVYTAGSRSRPMAAVIVNTTVGRLERHYGGEGITKRHGALSPLLDCPSYLVIH